MSRPRHQHARCGLNGCTSRAREWHRTSHGGAFLACGGCGRGFMNTAPWPFGAVPATRPAAQLAEKQAA